MKSTFTILITALTVTATYGQITTTKVATKAEKAENAPYDSTENFLGKDVYKYVGQELYLKGESESSRQYGYRNFLINYTESAYKISNIYKYECNDHSKYDELAGKYFTVLEVIKHPEAETKPYQYGNIFYLKLQEKETKDIVYYVYNIEYEYQFPFVVVGYFTKIKQSEVGKIYIVRGKNWMSSSEPMTDMKTGNPVSHFEAGEKWRCVDITIEEKHYTLSLVLENEQGEQIPLDVDNSKGTNWVFEFGKAELYKKKFGNDNWQSILKGKVRIGMTKEMCTLSWGKPKNINQTITAGKKSEQWVYSGNYLYFDNGILTGMQ